MSATDSVDTSTEYLWHKTAVNYKVMLLQIWRGTMFKDILQNMQLKYPRLCLNSYMQFIRFLIRVFSQ